MLRIVILTTTFLPEFFRVVDSPLWYNYEDIGGEPLNVSENIATNRQARLNILFWKPCWHCVDSKQVNPSAAKAAQREAPRSKTARFHYITVISTTIFALFNHTPAPAKLLCTKKTGVYRQNSGGWTLVPGSILTPTPRQAELAWPGKKLTTNGKTPNDAQRARAGPAR